MIKLQAKTFNPWNSTIAITTSASFTINRQAARQSSKMLSWQKRTSNLSLKPRSTTSAAAAAENPPKGKSRVAAV